MNAPRSRSSPSSHLKTGFCSGRPRTVYSVSNDAMVERKFSLHNKAFNPFLSLMPFLPHHCPSRLDPPQLSNSTESLWAFLFCFFLHAHFPAMTQNYLTWWASWGGGHWRGPKLIYPLSWFSVTPEPMLIGRSWLTRETREHFHTFEWFYCGSSGHFLANCPKCLLLWWLWCDGCS